MVKGPIPIPKQRQRFDKMYETLRTRICLLEYAPGERLSEERLAEEFGVSRTPLRRVLGRLESEGLLRSVQGVGTIVTDVDIDELEQIYQLRMELAELIGRLSPARVTPTLIEHFRDILHRCDELTHNPSPRRFAHINMGFLQLLLELTENAPLRAIMELLYYRTNRIIVRMIAHVDFLEEIEIFRREVADVLAAAQIGDLQAVGHIHRSHISMSFTRLRRSKPRAPEAAAAG